MGLLGVLIVSGVALVFIHGGPLFDLLAVVHRLATIAFTVVIAGHIVVASGILPGIAAPGGRCTWAVTLRLDTARRLWHSAQAEVLDMQEVSGSSPAPPPPTASCSN